MNKNLILGIICITAAGPALAESMKNFRWADKNRNGMVTRQEFIELRALWAKKKGTAHNLKQSESIFLNKDRNKDGELTPEEFMKR